MEQTPQFSPIRVPIADPQDSRESEPTRAPEFRQPRNLFFRSLFIRVTGSLIIAAFLVGIWTLVARRYPPAIVPDPRLVWERFQQAWSDGTYLPAFFTTAEEAMLGWLVAVLVAVPLGYLIGRLRALEDTLAPYLASSQAMPVVAIAPLLVVWVGVGLSAKVIVAGLIAFFPILATTASGVRGVPRDLRDAARVFGAGAAALAVHIDLPLAARSIFAGLKVGAALAVTGAVVGEFVGANQGLGYLVTFGSTSFDTPLMFVAVISLMILGAVAYGLVGAVERILLRWDE
ncbi:MAG TPA: ABC transporter permease [Chloroflexota bacterium]